MAVAGEERNESGRRWLFMLFRRLKCAWHNELDNYDTEESASSTLLTAVATYSYRQEGWSGNATRVKPSTNSYTTLLQTPGANSA